MKLPTFLQSLGLALLLLLSLPAHAQIPVSDAASISARAAQHAESLAKYLEQIATLKQQLKSAQEQYASITGVRNLGDILNNPAIRKSLPSDVQSVLKGGEGSLDSIQSSVARIQGEERISGDFSVDNQALTERIENLGIRSKALFEKGQEGMAARLEQLDQLQSQINQTTDPKAIGELQARLQVEQANIQADQIRADLLGRQIEAEKDLIDQQAAKMVSKTSLSVDAIRAPLPNLQQ